MITRDKVIRLLQAVSRIEGYVISTSKMRRPEGIGEDLEEAVNISLEILKDFPQETVITEEAVTDE